jgi:hypothetical protein
MAETALVEDIGNRTSLSRAAVEAGRQLIVAMDMEAEKKPTLRVFGAFWSVQDEGQHWLLTLALQKVASDGPRQAYASVHSVLKKRKVPYLAISDIKVIDRHDPAYRRLLKQIPVEGTSTSRRSGNIVSNALFPDFYIYRAT